MSTTTQLSARERINVLLDDNSFVEVGALITKRSTDFNLDQKDVPSDGVITGYGIIDGNPVYVYSQDSTLLGGSIGEMHAKKISHVYDMALKMGAPVVGLIDSVGMRLEEATDALNGFGEIYLKQTMASGIIPQITAIFGNSGGGLAVMASLSDFSFMEEKNSKLFINSPNAIQGNYKEKCDNAAAAFQSKAGTVDYVGTDENEVLSKIRELISLLPSSNEDDASYIECTDDLNRLLPILSSEINDSRRALVDISDNHYFFEIKQDYAKEMITGFIRLNGMTVGAIANRTEIQDNKGKATTIFDGTLTTDGCRKASSFVDFCDAFELPVLTLTNVSGYKATLDEEKTIAKASAELTYAFANATIPKINVIVGKAFGTAYITMNSKHIGADMVFALPEAKIGMMDAELAARIMYEGSTADVIKDKTAEYAKLQDSVEAAARRGYVDSIIEPEAVRKHLIYAFEMLFTKSEIRPAKKHGTI
ncbi:MAG TPA: carboxyl transferase domain-containing protein [Mobilitalea sp.]|nr:carboxyl transferase domain-containing protein [Mobilitalea sp.]